MKTTIGKGYLLAPLISLLCACPALAIPALPNAPLGAACSIVFVVDGAGGNQDAARAICAAAAQLHLPLQVRSFDWTHGQGHGFMDLVDVAHARRQGACLAAEVWRCRCACPGAPIYLVGFSAGSLVTLAAAENLPPNTVERIILLAPSVSAGYELRPALASARQGVDAFISERDRYYLGLGTTVMGTSDRKHQPAAGRVGFCPPALAPCEAWLAPRLHQHPWNPGVAWSGNDGGHSGSLQPCYLKGFVLPLLLPVYPTARR